MVNRHISAIASAAAHTTAIGGIVQINPPNTYFGKNLLTGYVHATPKGKTCMFMYIP